MSVTCGCVGLSDSRLFGNEVCLTDGGGRGQCGGTETAQKQSEAEHDHLQRARGEGCGGWGGSETRWGVGGAERG